MKNSTTVLNHLFMSKLISLINCLTLSRYKVLIEQRTNIYFLCLVGTKICKNFNVLRRMKNIYIYMFIFQLYYIVVNSHFRQ